MSDIIYWIFRMLLLPILFPLFFAIGIVKDYFSYAFSSVGYFLIFIVSPSVFFFLLAIYNESFAIVVLFFAAITVLSTLAVIVKVLCFLSTSYFSFDFDLSIDFLSECGGHIEKKPDMRKFNKENRKAKEEERRRQDELEREVKETTCGWCGNKLPGHYYIPRFIKDKPGRRYCSRRCLAAAGF